MKHKNIIRLISVSTTALAMAAVVFAQAGPPQGGQFGGAQAGPRQGGQFGGAQAGPRQGGQNQMRRGAGAGMMLVRMGSVQKELGMSAEQIKQINELRPMMQGGPGQGGPGGPPPQGGPGGPPQQGGQGGRGGQVAPPQQGGQGGFGGAQGGPGGPPQGGFGQGGPGQGMNNPLSDILSDKQMKRLRQLEIQFNAPMALLQPENANELQLSEDQRSEIDDIIKKAGLAMRGPMQGGPGGPPPQGGPGGPPPQGQGGPGQGGFGAPPQGGQGAQGGPPQQGGGLGEPPAAQGRAGGQRQQGGFGQAGPMVNFAEMQSKKAQAMKGVMSILNSSQKETWRKLVGNEFTKWEEPKRPQPEN